MPHPAAPDDRPLTELDYQNLLGFRSALRKFLSWSETRAREAGLTPAQHQLLLAVKGHPGVQPPAVGDIADGCSSSEGNSDLGLCLISG